MWPGATGPGRRGGQGLLTPTWEGNCPTHCLTSAATQGSWAFWEGAWSLTGGGSSPWPVHLPPHRVFLRPRPSSRRPPRGRELTDPEPCPRARIMPSPVSVVGEGKGNDPRRVSPGDSGPRLAAHVHLGSGGDGGARGALMAPAILKSPLLSATVATAGRQRTGSLVPEGRFSEHQGGGREGY